MSYKIKLLNKDLKEFYKTTNAYKKYGNEYKRFMKSLPALLIKYQDQLQINEYQILKGGIIDENISHRRHCIL